MAVQSTVWKMQRIRCASEGAVLHSSQYNAASQAAHGKPRARIAEAVYVKLNPCLVGCICCCCLWRKAALHRGRGILEHFVLCALVLLHYRFCGRNGISLTVVEAHECSTRHPAVMLEAKHCRKIPAQQLEVAV